MLTKITLTLVALLQWTTLVLAVSPVVSLSYGQYQGTPLANGLTQWLGIGFAQPPVGSLRWQAPVYPSSFQGIKAANKYGPGCSGLGPSVGTEDCLYLDIFAPSSATSSSPLPVYVFIQGGGLQSAGGHYNSSNLINSNGNSFIVVTFTYRVGGLGFMASKEIQSQGSLNNGFKDQRMVLQWVQKEIAQFGGDPNHVVLGGQSAGAGSVIQHLTAYGGRNDNLFQAAFSQSQSMPATRTVADSQYQYDQVSQCTGCNTASNSFTCMQALSSSALYPCLINAPFPDSAGQGKPIFPYNGVLDNDFITNYPVANFQSGNFVKVPTILGDDANEGTIFTPQNINNTAMAEAFLQNNFPKLTPSMLSVYNTSYAFYQPGASWWPYWWHASIAYGETRYICPGMYIGNSLSSYGVPVWNYRYDVMDPVMQQEGLNVAHGSEQPAIWGYGGPASYNNINANIVPLMQAYVGSFITTLNPNAKTISYGVSAGKRPPTWNMWSNSTASRLHLTANTTGMETVSQAQYNRCMYLSSNAVNIAQ